MFLSLSSPNSIMFGIDNIYLTSRMFQCSECSWRTTLGSCFTLGLEWSVQLWHWAWMSYHAGVWMFVTSPNLYVEILTPRVIVSGGGTFCKLLCHEDKTLRMGIVHSRSRSWRVSLPPCHEWGCLWSRKQALPSVIFFGVSSLDFQSMQLQERHFSCWKSFSV